MCSPTTEMTTLDTNAYNKELLREGGETRTSSTVSTRPNMNSFIEGSSEMNGYTYGGASSSNYASGSGQPSPSSPPSPTSQ